MTEQTSEIADMVAPDTYATGNFDNSGAELLQAHPELLKTEGNQAHIPVFKENVLAALLFLLRPINFHKESGLPDGEPLTKRHIIILVIRQILAVAKEHRLALCISGGVLYCYNGEYWKAAAKEELRPFLGQAAAILGADPYDAEHYKFKEELFKQFITSAFQPKPQRKPEEVLINLQNGTYVFTPIAQYIREFNRADFLTYQLPFGYDPQAKAFRFQQYLDRVLPDPEQQLILAEFVAYIFIRQKSLKLEKSLILYGGGANGKSVFFEIITAMLGSENISNFSLQSLTNESGYQRAKLANKLLNYASEISPHMDSTVFKQLVSGEPVEARLPYGEPFVLEDYSKLLFNTNELPKDVEQNEAFFRRFIILHFGITIPQAERDPELAKKIITTELPGVFNWVLDGLSRLLKQRKFTHSDAVEGLLQQYRQQSDSVQLFLADSGYSPSTTKEVTLKTLYFDYRNYCQQYGYKPCALRSCTERLKNQGYDSKRKNYGVVIFAEKKSFF